MKKYNGHRYFKLELKDEISYYKIKGIIFKNFYYKSDKYMVCDIITITPQENKLTRNDIAYSDFFETQQSYLTRISEKEWGKIYEKI